MYVRITKMEVLSYDKGRDGRRSGKIWIYRLSASQGAASYGHGNKLNVVVVM